MNTIVQYTMNAQLLRTPLQSSAIYEFVCTGVSAANETIALYGWKDKPTLILY